MNLFDFIPCILATAYLSFVTVNTDGLFGMFVWLRKHDPVKVTHCIYCVAFWIAGLLVWLAGIPLTLVNVLAVAGGALMLSSWTGLRHL